ncbi:MAG: hypothetical protein ACLFUS_07315 [Candidatus Sumerlaeia bacterium]
MKKISRLLIILGGLLAIMMGPATSWAQRLQARIIGQSNEATHMYMRAELTNPYGRDMGFRLEIKNMGYQQNYNLGEVVLGPGQRRVLHIPLLKTDYGNFTIESRDETGEQSRDVASRVLKLYLNIDTLRSWATESQMIDFTNKFNGITGGASLSRYHGSSGNFVSQIEPDLMPDNWMCYLPFRAVMLPEAIYRRLPPVSLNALTEWVQSGGQLVIYEAERAASERMMLGRIDYVAKNPIKVNILDKNWTRQPTEWRRFFGNTGSLAYDFPFIIESSSGRLGGVILATLFFIVAGPINHFYFSRKKKIRTLLLSLPVLSLGFCFLIFIYFLASQGFARRGGSISVMVMDEKEDKAFTFSRHVFYSGLYPLGGFKFDGDTAFCPMVRDMDEQAMTFDLSEGYALESGLFTPSRNFHYLTATPMTTRAKLIWDKEEMTVTNGFDAAIEHVLIQDGNVIYESREIAKGGKGKMKQIDTESNMGAGKILLARRGGPQENLAITYIERHMDDMTGVFDADSEYATYAIFFKSPPADTQAGVNIKGDNKFFVLVARSERMAGATQSDMAMGE